MKQHCRGLTLIEILLSLTMLSLILGLLIPQLLRYTHEQTVNKTVAEMNQIVLAARNYYQENRVASGSMPSASYWPQTLNDLVSKSYLPQAALCSAWPSATVTTACKNHQAYVLFPSNDSGQYDTSVLGIAANGLNKGGNFWGVSITLPNARIAEEVRQKMPFATRCDVTQLKTGNACSSANNSTTVTAIVPRPAVWPQQVTAQYAIDGLIQSIGSIDMCDDSTAGVSPCDDKDYKKNGVSAYITMPTTCAANNLTPVLFVYPMSLYTYIGGNTSPFNPNFPGIAIKTSKYSSTQWRVQARSADDTRNTSNGPEIFHTIQIAYFTVCAPNGDPNKWDPSNFPAISKKHGVQW